MDNFKRAIHICINRESGQVIVIPCYNHAGLFAEIPGAGEIYSMNNVTEVGEAIKKALADSRFEKEFNYHDRNESDWPAYKISGEKTLRDFKSKYQQFSLIGSTDQNATYEFTTPPPAGKTLATIEADAPVEDFTSLLS